MKVYSLVNPDQLFETIITCKASYMSHSMRSAYIHPSIYSNIPTIILTNQTRVYGSAQVFFLAHTSPSYRLTHTTPGSICTTLKLLQCLFQPTR